MSKIEWTGRTWNPLVGCTIHSAGCKGCFAMRDAYRLMHNPNPAIAKKFAGTAKMVNGHAVWTGKINFSSDALLAPLRRRVPTTYFVNSLSDLFHQSVSDEKIDLIFAVMALCPQHTFQVLTKRSDRMRAYFAETWQPAPARDVKVAGETIHLEAEPRGDDRWDQINSAIDDITLGLHGGAELFEHKRFWTTEGDLIGRPAWPRRPLPNVWLGVSVEDQRSADERIPDLLATSAAVRFLSCEPLLAPLNLRKIVLRRDGQAPTKLSNRLGDYVQPLAGNFTDSPRIGWVIAGGESGPRARPMHPDWARDLRDQCAEAGVPFFFKQWGDWLPGEVFTEVRDGVTRGGLSRFPDGPEGETFPGKPSHWWGDAATFTPGLISVRVGKGVAGRRLDGVEHSAMPAVAHG